MATARPAGQSPIDEDQAAASGPDGLSFITEPARPQQQQQHQQQQKNSDRGTNSNNSNMAMATARPAGQMEEDRRSVVAREEEEEEDKVRSIAAQEKDDKVTSVAAREKEDKPSSEEVEDEYTADRPAGRSLGRRSGEEVDEGTHSGYRGFDRRSARRRSVQAAEDDDSTLARNGARCHPMVCCKFYFSNWIGVE